jgi:hypothetical protein
MPVPTLLLKPEETRHRTGTLIPAYYGTKRVVDGQYGQAWDMQKYSRNIVLNPSFETNLNHTAPLGGAQRARLQQKATSGTYAMRVYCDGSQTSQGVVLYTEPPSGSGTYYGQLRLSADGNILINRLYMQINYTDGTASYSSVAGFTATPEGTLVYQTAVPTSGKTIQEVWWNIFPHSITIPFYMYIDSVMIERKSASSGGEHSPYFDGSIGGFVYWEGTTHESPSWRRANAIVLNRTYLKPRVGTAIFRYRKRRPTSGINSLLMGGNLNPAPNVFGWMYQGDTTVTGGWRAESELIAYSAGVTAAPAGQWSTAAMRWKDTGFDTYAEGALTARATRQLPPEDWQTNAYVEIGTYNYTTTNDLNGFWGDLESVALFDEELSFEHINRIRNINGTWTWDEISAIGTVEGNVFYSMSSSMPPVAPLRSVSRTFSGALSSTFNSSVVVRNRTASSSTVMRTYLLMSDLNRLRNSESSATLSMDFQGTVKKIASSTLDATLSIGMNPVDSSRLREGLLFSQLSIQFTNNEVFRSRVVVMDSLLQMFMSSESFVITEFPRLDATMRMTQASIPVRRRNLGFNANFTTEFITKVPEHIFGSSDAALTFQIVAQVERIRRGKLTAPFSFFLMANGVHTANFNAENELGIRQRSGLIHFIAARETGHGNIIHYLHVPTEETQSEMIFLVTSEDRYPYLVGWATTEWAIRRVTIETDKDVYDYPDILDQFHIERQVQS